MSPGATPKPEDLFSLVSELEKLADDIASLSKLLAEAEGTYDAMLIQQIVHHLESAMEQLMDRPGMLDEPAPWWTNWRNNDPAR